MTTYTGVVKTYYDMEETKLKEEYILVNGKKEGIKKLYYIGKSNINGKLSSIVNYINDYMDGEFKYVKSQINEHDLNTIKKTFNFLNKEMYRKVLNLNLP
jgi:antitoxin component YwqK of YwqJK toxin-antitoxin module